LIIDNAKITIITNQSQLKILIKPVRKPPFCWRKPWRVNAVFNRLVQVSERSIDFFIMLLYSIEIVEQRRSSDDAGTDGIGM